jgi:hypothetical protein
VCKYSVPFPSHIAGQVYTLAGCSMFGMLLFFLSSARASDGCEFTSYLAVAEKSRLHIGRGETALVVKAKGDGYRCVELGDLRKVKKAMGETTALAVILPDGTPVIRSDIGYAESIITGLRLGEEVTVQLLRPSAPLTEADLIERPMVERGRECKSNNTLDENDRGMPPKSYTCADEKWIVEETYRFVVDETEKEKKK